MSRNCTRPQTFEDSLYYWYYVWLTEDSLYYWYATVLGHRLFRMLRMYRARKHTRALAFQNFCCAQCIECRRTLQRWRLVSDAVTPKHTGALAFQNFCYWGADFSEFGALIFQNFCYWGTDFSEFLLDPEYHRTLPRWRLVAEALRISFSEFLTFQNFC